MYQRSVIGLLVIVLTAAGCSSSGSITKVLAGELVLSANTAIAGVTGFGVGDLIVPSNAVGVDCTGAAGYSDIESGAEVRVKDETGTIIAIGDLDPGVLTDVQKPAADTIGVGDCTWEFAVPDVPADRKFYTVEVSHRGEVTFSATEMEGSGWTVALSLGS